MNKTVIIINGSGGVGKDTLCDIVGKHYRTTNISSIDPIKEIALQNGWKGDKSPKSRKFLSELKKLFIDFNDLPCTYLNQKYLEFLTDDKEILFVHIREPQEIEKFKQMVKSRCVTLLIRGRDEARLTWQNESDDEVEQYQYDYYYKNDKKLDEVEKDFMQFIAPILQK